MRAAGWVFGGVVAVLVTGWGAQAQTFAPACGLMTQAVAAGLNGAPVLAGQETDVPKVANVCSFTGDGNDGTVSVGESLDSPGGMSFKTLEMNPPAAATTMKVLSGLGDGAYFTQVGSDYDVWVLKGQVVLDITVTPAKGGVAGLEAAMVAAAKIAVKGM